jgi:uncharacterized protein YukE
MSLDINIELDPFNEELRSLNTSSSEIHNEKTDVIKKLGDLSEAWIGTSGSAYIAALSCLKAGFFEYSRGIDQLIDCLEFARNVVIEADTTGAGR